MVTALTVVIVGLGIVFQAVATTSHEKAHDAPASSSVETPPAPDGSGADAEKNEGRTNDHTGKPGEVK
ncbi:hypothetical protein [Acrocarpospora sp. B8E8]|uniref:hypothetical protein n=1 Tax=Acrocarpospora sp. B8E8 TaxID=3153572 RepID=UPI00325FC3D4